MDEHPAAEGKPELPARRAETGSRRARRDSGRRMHLIGVKVSKDELIALRLQAAAANVSVPRLLVESTRAGTGGVGAVVINRELIDELFGLRRLLANVANNMNQIARAYNSGTPQHSELVGTLAHLRSYFDRMGDLLDRMAAR